MKFSDRIAAGHVLADVLKTTTKSIDHDELLVLGIPRGGVIVANVVATRLHANLDVIIPMKLRSPYKSNSIGAVMPDGLTYINESKVRLLKVSPQHVENEKLEQLKEIERRMALYRPFNREYKIKDKVVILVDDGIATGSTIIAAARWIRKQEPRLLVVAAPVVNYQALDLLKKESRLEKLITITTPPNFVAIREFYKTFDTVTDEQIVEILNKSLTDSAD